MPLSLGANPSKESMTTHKVPRQRDAKGRFVRRGARLGGTPSRIARPVAKAQNASTPWRLGGNASASPVPMPAVDRTTRARSTVIIREEPDPYPPRPITIADPSTRSRAELPRTAGNESQPPAAIPSSNPAPPSIVLLLLPAPPSIVLLPPAPPSIVLLPPAPPSIALLPPKPLLPPVRIPSPLRKGILDPLTGRCFVFGNKEAGASSIDNGDEWKIIASGGGKLPISFSGLIQPKTTKLMAFSHEVALPADTSFNADRFEWRPRFQDEHEDALKRIREIRAGGRVLNDMGTKNAFVNLQLRTGSLIAHPKECQATGVLQLLVPNGKSEKTVTQGPLCAGYAVTSEGTVLGAMLIEPEGKPSWVATRGRVTVAQARSAASLANSSIGRNGGAASPVAELRAPSTARELFIRCPSVLSPNAFLSLLSASRL